MKSSEDILKLVDHIGSYIDLMDNVLRLENEGLSNLHIVNESRRLENRIVSSIGQVIINITSSGTPWNSVTEPAKKDFIIQQLDFIDHIIEKYHCVLKDMESFSLEISYKSIEELNKNEFEGLEDLPEDLFQYMLTLRYILDEIIGKQNKAFRGLYLNECYLVRLMELEENDKQ